MQNDILMIDDDSDLNEIVGMYLENNGMIFRSIHKGCLLKEELDKKVPDLIILDIELPDIDGFELCQIIQEKDENLPIIFLTNHHEEENRIRAFRLGGSDFVGKPFSLEELRLRIVARLKDKQNFKQLTCLKFGNMRLNLQTEELIYERQSISLTSTEMNIFHLLASHPDKIYSEREIYENVWNDQYVQDTRMVNVHISNLRKKIQKIDSKHKYIQTVWGKGYKYVG
ncbi:MAG: response regulator transcription factor [Longibaculum sp.]